MAGAPRGNAQHGQEEGSDEGKENPTGEPTDNRAVVGADRAHLSPRLNDVPQDVPLVDVDAVESWQGQAPVADHEDERSVRPPPGVLVARGRTRYVRLLFWVGAGSILILPQALEGYGGSEDGFATLWSYTSYIGVVAAIFGSIAVRGFLRGIRADQNGVTVVTFFHRELMPWHQLRGIGFDPDDSKAMYYKLVFTTAGRSVTAPVPGGGKESGEYLHDLRETLLAMQAANAFRFDGAGPMRLRVPNHTGGRRLRLRYSEGDMRLRVTYPARGRETPSGLVIRSEHDTFFVILLLAAAFCALMAWAANGPPPDGDVASARFAGVLALGLLVGAWRYASLGLLRATKRGIVIAGFVSRRRLAWADLLDVTFHTVAEPETADGRYEVLVLEMSDEAKGSRPPRPRDLAGDFGVEQVRGDAHDPADSLHFVRRALLAMRDQYAATPPAQPDIQDS